MRSFKLTLILLFLFLTVGCEKKKPGTPAGTDTAARPQVSSANDPRWRNELFQSNVAAIRNRAEYPSLPQYLTSLNLVTQRFNSWLTTREAFEGWNVDPLVQAEIELLDSLEPLAKQTFDAYAALRNIPDETPCSDKQLAQITELEKKLQDFCAACDACSNKGILQGTLEFLAGKMAQFRTNLIAGSAFKKITPQLKNQLRAQNQVLAELGILYGSRRMNFDGTENSDVQLQNIAYEKDVYVLFEQFLLQDLSQWAQGTPLGELEEVRLENRNQSDTVGAKNKVRVSAEDSDRMTAIFQWVVTNIRLEENSSPRLPLEILLSGSGSVTDRAWLTILLARQQDLNAFVLEVPTPSGNRLLIGFLHNEEIYVFDPEIGRPILNAEKPATWSEISANPAILEEFWKRGGVDVQITPEDLPKSRGFLEVSPWYQTQRGMILQEALKNGENRVILSLDPVEVLTDGSVSPDSLETAHNAPSTLKAEILKKRQFASVSAWNFPVDTVVRRAFTQDFPQILAPYLTQFPDGEYPIWRGQMLYLQGVLTGPMSAAGAFQQARLSEMELEAAFQKAGPATMDHFRVIRALASNSLALISCVMERPDAAIDTYERHVLSTPVTSLHDAARCNAGRMCEQKNDPEAAKKFYSEVKGPMKPQAQFGL
ncbi:MAG: hypothetical protein Q4A17_04850 [Thermoguttaceae bacterium]|nr:hypothetical protein [Thermoguttaceae bacterium]